MLLSKYGRRLVPLVAVAHLVLRRVRLLGAYDMAVDDVSVADVQLALHLVVAAFLP